MDCCDVRKLLAEGDGLSSEEVQAHLKLCAPCRQLAKDGGRLAAAMGSNDGGLSDMDSLLGLCLDGIEREKGVGAWLRSRPNPVRWSVALGAVTMVVLASWILLPRADLQVYPSGRMFLVLGLLGLASILAIWLILRPLHRPALPPLWALGVLIIAVLLPVGAGFLPAAHLDHPSSMAGAGDDWLKRAWPCFVYGLLSGLPVLVLAWWMDRRGRRALIPLFLSAAVAGLAGNLALQMHCPLTSPLHLLTGHASVGIALVLVFGGLGIFLSRRV